LVLHYGKGLIACGILSLPDLERVEFAATDSNDEQEFLFISNDVNPEVWNNLLLEIDPEIMSFSCYINDQFVGSGTPDQTGLRDMTFSRYLQIGFGPETQTRILFDNVRRSP